MSSPEVIAVPSMSTIHGGTARDASFRCHLWMALARMCIILVPSMDGTGQQGCIIWASQPAGQGTLFRSFPSFLSLLADSATLRRCGTGS